MSEDIKKHENEEIQIMKYLLLAPVEDKDSENVYVFRIDEVDGKQELNLVEDDKEFIAVKKEYSKLLY